MVLEKISIIDLSDVQDIAQTGFEARWTDQEFAYFLCHDMRLCLGVREGGKLVSYVLALLTQGDLDIISIATHADYLRRGYARAVLSAALAAPGVERAFLEVDKENTSALKLYEAMGFQIYLERKNYYDGKRDAWCLKKELTPNPSP